MFDSKAVLDTSARYRKHAATAKTCLALRRALVGPVSRSSAAMRVRLLPSDFLL